MSKWKTWTQQEYDQLERLIKQGLNNYEIADLMGRPRNAISIKANRYFGGNPNYLSQITKHKHLREPAMRYFMTHTSEQTQKKFKLTESEFKSLLTVGYRDKKLRHLRKDTRRHDSWTGKELQFLIQHAGIMPRDWIGERLKRGNAHSCIKERLEKLGISSKSINGITLSQYRLAFGKEPSFYIQTKAGPGRNGTPTCYKIIPWVHLRRELNQGRIQAPQLMKLLIETMAMFQDWIFEGQAIHGLKKISRKRIAHAEAM